MDQFDRAQELEELHRTTSLHNARARRQEKPHEDDHGRYCLDCDDEIPQARVNAVNAVRCIQCQTKRETTRGR